MIAAAAALPVAAESLDTSLIELLGAASAALATIGLLLLLPIYITHRREVQRLLEWQDRDPEAGTTEFRAVPGPGVATRSGGKMTPAERVTSERPALTRISTAEYAAIEPEPQGFWQRVVDRGPRHPLVLTIAALLVGVIAFVLASQLIRSDEDNGSKGKLDPASIEVAIVNGTSEPGVGNDVADKLSKAGFTIGSNTAAADPAKASGVFFAQGQRSEGRAVARALELPTPAVFGSEEEAAANGADVVVVAGEDGKAGGSKDSEGDSGDSGGKD